MDEDEQYPTDAVSQETELGAHGMRIDGEDEEGRPRDIEEEGEVEDDLI